MIRSTLAALGALALLAVQPASAQPASGPCAGQVDISRAIEIARGAGVVRAEQADCDDGAWQVEGRDDQGRKIKVDVDPRDGRVIRTRRD